MQEVENATWSADKVRKYLGYETKTSLEEAINKTIDYIKKRGVKPFNYSLPLEIINDKTPDTCKKN